MYLPVWRIRDVYPGSRIRTVTIPDPGCRGQKGTQSRIPDPDPQHWYLQLRHFDLNRHCCFLVPEEGEASSPTEIPLIMKF
jgi:hypothetical protein